MADEISKETAEAYERLTIYSNALNKSLEVFISSSEAGLDKVMSNALHPIADAASLDRIIVFQIFGVDNLTAGEVYRWDKIIGGTAPIDPSLATLPVTSALKRWISIIKNDSCISLKRSDFSEDEEAFLGPRGVQSILIMPVFAEREFWGVVTFHDNSNERVFDEDCIKLLRSTARLSANRIIRDIKARAAEETTEVLKQRKELTDVLNRTAVLFLSQSDLPFADMMEVGIKLIVDLVNIDRFSIFRHFDTPGNPHSEQIYRWDRETGGTTQINRFLPEINFEQYVPDLSHPFADGKMINGPVRLMPNNEASSLRASGAISAFATPVYINNSFWGFALYEDHQNERSFEVGHAELMRSAAFLFTNAYIRAEMELVVTNKNLFLYTLNHISAIMLQSNISNFENNLLRSMSILAEAVGADRVYVWKNYVKDDVLHCMQLYEWSNGVPSQQGSDLARGIAYKDIVPEWEKQLSQGQSINGIISKMSKDEKAALSPQGILSILIEPVFLQNKFWGFFGFDDCHNERLFSDNDEMILRAASQLMSNALIRNEMERKVTDESELNRVLFDTAPIGLITFNDDLNIVDCNDAVLNIFEATKENYLGHFSDFTPTYQPEGQKTVDLLDDIMRRALNGDRQVVELMFQKPDGEPIPCEVVMTCVKYNGKYIGLFYLYDLRNIRKMEESIQLLETEANKIFYDALTGIYNRRYFDEKLDHLINLLSRSDGVLSLMMIDIDFFKNYNDTYGHSEGDKCLKKIAETLTNTITRAEDFVARYGGEEFVVVLPNTDESGTRIIANKMLDNVRKCNLLHEKSEAAKIVTVSIGVTSGRVEHMHTKDDFIQRADEMLYKSKSTGRDRYHYDALQSHKQT